MTTTAEQIAKKLGVSNATVSRVLNNHQRVSPETREAVLAAVREAGGPPRTLGRRIRSANPARASTTPGLMQIVNVHRFPIASIPTQAHAAISADTIGQLPQAQFFSPDARLATAFSRHIIDGIVEELRHFGKRAVVQVVTDLRSRDLLNEVNRRENQGLFLLGIHDDDVVPFLENCRCPVVTFMTWRQNGWIDYVGIDNALGIRQSFEHLVNLNHKRIGYIAGELRFSAVFRDRLAAYKTLLADAGWSVRPEWIAQGSCDLLPIQESVEKMLKGPERPTALICAFDTAAVAVKRAADRLGLQIPRDLSVVGFNDEDIALLFTPPLTTVRVPTTLMGQQAVQLMMMRQQRPVRRGEALSARVTPILIERQSTAPPVKLD